MAHSFGCTGKLARNKSPKGLTSFHLRPPITFLVLSSFCSCVLSPLLSPLLFSPLFLLPLSSLSHHLPPPSPTLFSTLLLSPSFSSGLLSFPLHSSPVHPLPFLTPSPCHTSQLRVHPLRPNDPLSGHSPLTRPAKRLMRYHYTSTNGLPPVPEAPVVDAKQGNSVRQ